jgi:hypothetical protein
MPVTKIKLEEVVGRTSEGSASKMIEYESVMIACRNRSVKMGEALRINIPPGPGKTSRGSYFASKLNIHFQREGLPYHAHSINGGKVVFVQAKNQLF